MKISRRIIPWLALLVVTTLNPQLSTVFAQSVTFTTNNYNVPDWAMCVMATNINGSGKPDLIALDCYSLVLLTNNGSGIFGSNATPFTVSPVERIERGTRMTKVVAADVNGDSKPDLILLEQTSFGGTLYLLTNNGSGAFGPNATLCWDNRSILCDMTDVVAANVNGDGKAELIVADALFNTLIVLTNNGRGAFGFNAFFNVGSEPDGVAPADVNGDGTLDLISANYKDNTLTVLTNNGHGVFGSNATLNAGSGPFCVIAADVNGDGKADLISANYWDNTLTVLTNNGGGVFGSNATLNVGRGPRCVIAADVNGDGALDLISANYGTHTLTVLSNNGRGVFGSNATLNVGSEPLCVIAADVNGGGKADLVSANFWDGTLTVLINTTPLPAPALNIVSAGNRVALYWPAWATNYVLEATTNLAASDWVTVTNDTPITGGVTLTNTWPVAYFRLHQF